MSRRVVVVEDNPASLELMLYLLKSFNFSVAGFSRAAEALDALQKEQFDLALVDILMPEMDGFEFAKHVRANEGTKQLPLVAITALAMVGDRERVLSAGFDGYIPKPIDPERFISQLQLFFVQAHGERAQTPSGPPILVVDDMHVNRQVIRGALAPFGYRIAEASGAREALAEIAREKPALILCDVHMPAGDGFTLIQSVKNDEQMRDIPFVFISSTAWQSKDKRRAVELGAQKFILRPIDPQNLLDEVRGAIEGGGGKSSGR